MEIRRLGPTDIEPVIAASSLFDGPASPEWASLLLAREGHHMLIAYVDDASAGFVSGVEMTHPDKARKCSSLATYQAGGAEHLEPFVTLTWTFPEHEHHNN